MESWGRGDKNVGEERGGSQAVTRVQLESILSPVGKAARSVWSMSIQNTCVSIYR